MTDRFRRRLRYFWPHGHPWHPASSYGPAYGPMLGWGRRREPSVEEEKEFVDDYIEMLKEELAAAEEYRKDMEETE